VEWRTAIGSPDSVPIVRRAGEPGLPLLSFAQALPADLVLGFVELLPDQLLLHVMQYCLGVVQSQAYVLDALTRAVKGLDRDAEWRSVRGIRSTLEL